MAWITPVTNRTDGTAMMTAADMNRISGNLYYLGNTLLPSRGYSVTLSSTKFTWSVSDIITLSDWNKLIADLETMHYAITGSSLAEEPSTRMTYDNINLVESIMVRIHHLMTEAVSIEIVGELSKLYYAVGERMQVSGITVVAHYADGEEIDITNAATYSPADGSVVMASTYYLEALWAGLDDWQPLFIARSITIEQPPANTLWEEGDELDLWGMVVMAHYANGEMYRHVDITSECTFTPAEGTVLTTSDTSVFIKYYNLTAWQPITVMKIVSWANGTDADILAMVLAADEGVIDLTDYWDVEDVRRITLGEMTAYGTGETIPAQSIDIALVHPGGKTLETATPDGRTECSFIWQTVQCFGAMPMNPTNTTAGGWPACGLREWLNTEFYNALPEYLQVITKKFENKSLAGMYSSNIVTSYDYCAIPAIKEVNGNGGVYAGEGILWNYYETNMLQKYLNPSTTVYGQYWLRTPVMINPQLQTRFMQITNSGSTGFANPTDNRAIALFGCI